MIDTECLHRLQREIHFALDADHETRPIASHAERLANHLYQEIVDGRYTTKHSPEELRRRRDASVLADFNGRNRETVMRKHRISRRLFYSIIARAHAMRK